LILSRRGFFFFFKEFFTVVIHMYSHLFQFCHCTNIYSKWLGEQFRISLLVFKHVVHTVFATNLSKKRKEKKRKEKKRKEILIRLTWLRIGLCGASLLTRPRNFRFPQRHKLNSVALLRERTIPTERPPPVGEVSANFCG
jgi:hypothetical protein